MCAQGEGAESSWETPAEPRRRRGGALSRRGQKALEMIQPTAASGFFFLSLVEFCFPSCASSTSSFETIQKSPPSRK